MKTNGSFKTLLDQVGEVEVPALIIDHFAVHHMLQVENRVYFANTFDERGYVNGSKKIENVYAIQHPKILNISHVPSGKLIYCPKFRDCKIAERTWLKQLREFIAAIKLMANWEDSQPVLKDGRFHELKAALPQGNLDKRLEAIAHE